MNSSRKVFSLGRLAIRQFSQTTARNAKQAVPARIQRLKETQKKFQVDDGLPVYLKAGFRDKALFQVSVLLTLVGVGMSIETFCRLSFK